MKTISHLYYVKYAYWLDMPYSKALRTKIALSNIVISLIHNKPFKQKTNEDIIRVKDCLDAITFNEKLLKE